jgi:hypothetical protein
MCLGVEQRYIDDKMGFKSANVSFGKISSCKGYSWSLTQRNAGLLLRTYTYMQPIRCTCLYTYMQILVPLYVLVEYH